MNNIELVYFVFPSCDGNCRHCWSSDMLLGRIKNKEWHYCLIDKLAEFSTYSTIKLSGGEPFKNKDIGKIAYRIHQRIDNNIPIQIFTSGRPFISVKEGNDGIRETMKNLHSYFQSFDNISIQLSIDEHHIHVLEKVYNLGYDSSSFIKNYVLNFMNACLKIKNENSEFLGPKLKIHCGIGRMNYHKDYFSWIPTEWWNDYIIITEGLVSSGNAKSLNGTFKIAPNDMISYFLLPGVSFYDAPKTNRAIIFNDNEKNVYLDDADDKATIIEGWWNLINRYPQYKTFDKIFVC